MSVRATIFLVLITLGCAMNAACVQDTPRSILQNSNDYAERILVPSVLSDTVRRTLTSPAGNQLSFKKLTLKRTATVMIQGNPVNWSSDLFYENAGDGLVREVETEYKNGIETLTSFNLTYRGIYPLLYQKVVASARNLPYTVKVVSISHADLSLGQSSLDYSYIMRSNAPRARDLDESISCQLTVTHPGSFYISGVQGEAREFSCKTFNSNGVEQREQDFVYLNNYGIAFPKAVKQANLSLYWNYSAFKAE